jgi:hypothetical protein
MLFLHDFVNHCSGFNHLHYVLFCCTFQCYRMCHLIVSSGLVALTAVNATGPSCVSTIAKQLVIFDLVNKFFQQVSLFYMVNMLLYEVLKQRVLLCYGQQLSRNEVGTPEKDLRRDCLVLHFTSSLMTDWLEGKSCQCGLSRNPEKTQ